MNVVREKHFAVKTKEGTFSLSGMENKIRGMAEAGTPPADVARFTFETLASVLARTTAWAQKQYGNLPVLCSGGVASNSALRAAMEEACQKEGFRFYRPSPVLCTDNAAMIGAAAYYEYKKGARSGWDLNAVPNLKLGER